MLRVIDDTHLANIGDALRETLGEDSHFLVDDMDQAIKYSNEVAFGNGYEEGEEFGYNTGWDDGAEWGQIAGYEEGYNEGVAEGTEAGKTAERNSFWEVFQKGGSRSDWRYCFITSNFTDKTYNPIYPIKLSTNNCTNSFYQTALTDTKVPIDATDVTLNNTFRYAKFVTITELIVSESTDVKTGLTNMSALKNLTVTGTIGKNFDISDSPLTAESFKSIITALKDFTGGNEYSCTLTVNSSAFNSLEAEGATAEYNGKACTWAELIGFKKWNLTKA